MYRNRTQDIVGCRDLVRAFVLARGERSTGYNTFLRTTDLRFKRPLLQVAR